jgi:UDP-2,4-diacetamido-2,4,6-trideoxy-beta-L-altropyranose hydrolase
MPGETLTIRADASAEIGVGHVMRCLALAQAWQDTDGRVLFVLASCPEPLLQRLRKERCEHVLLKVSSGTTDDAEQTITLAQKEKSRSVVLDGSSFGGSYQELVQQSGLKLLILDDYASAERYCADWVWNADMPVRPEMYAGKAPGARLLLGPEYALLRREFMQQRGDRPGRKAISNVLITMGGSDPQNMTLTAIRGVELLQNPALRTRVVVGPANPRLDSIRLATQELKGGAEVLGDAQDMAAQMGWADIAVTAAGVTLWELLHMGPAVVGWPRYPADVEVLASLAQLGAAKALSPDADARAIAQTIEGLLKGPAERQRMRDTGQRVVDGRGSERVVQSMLGVAPNSGRRGKVPVP